MKTLALGLAALACFAGPMAGLAQEKETKRDEQPLIAYLGVATENVDPAVARHLKLRPGEGLTVTMVDPKSPAHEVLKEDDVLKEIEGQWLVSPEQLQSLVRLFKPGDSVTLHYIREGDAKKATVKLGERRDPGDWMTRARRMMPQEDPWQMMRRWQMPQVDAPQRDDDEEVEATPKAHGRKDRPQQPESTIHISSSSSLTENGRTATLTNENGRKHLKVTKEGKTLFEGPVDTDEQVKNLEPEMRELFDRMNNQGGATMKLRSSQPKSGRVDI